MPTHEDIEISGSNIATQSYLSVTSNLLESLNEDIKNNPTDFELKQKILSTLNESFSFFEQIKRSVLEDDISQVESLKSQLDALVADTQSKLDNGDFVGTTNDYNNLLNAPNINSGNYKIGYIHEYQKKIEISDSTSTHNILRFSQAFWGSGFFKIELYFTYPDGRVSNYGLILARGHTSLDYSPSTNIETLFPPIVSPFWSDISYVDGSTVGYADLKITLPPYCRCFLKITVIDSLLVPLADCYDNNKYFIY